MFIEFKAIIFVHCGVNGTVQTITFSDGFIVGCTQVHWGCTLNFIQLFRN